MSVQKTVFLCINLRKKSKIAQLMGLKLNRLALQYPFSNILKLHITLDCQHFFLAFLHLNTF